MKKQKEEAEVQVYTKYERARMIGSRALQIAMGAPFMIKMEQEDLEKVRYDPVKIAEMESEKGLIPMTVRRPMPSPKKKTVSIPKPETSEDKEEQKEE